MAAPSRDVPSQAHNGEPSNVFGFGDVGNLKPRANLQSLADGYLIQPCSKFLFDRVEELSFDMGLLSSKSSYVLTNLSLFLFYDYGTLLTWIANNMAELVKTARVGGKTFKTAKKLLRRGMATGLREIFRFLFGMVAGGVYQ